MDNQQVVTESSPPQKSKLNFTLWIAVGVVMLAIGIGIGIGLALGKYLTLSPAEIPAQEGNLNSESTGSAATANWKTYTNEKYKYRTIFPEDWQVNSHATDEKDNLTSSAHFHKVGIVRNGSKWPGFTLYVKENHLNFSLSQLCNKASQANNMGDVQFYSNYPCPNGYKPQIENLNGNSWEKTEPVIAPNSGTGYLTYSTSHNNLLFFILEFEGRYENDIEKVLQNFKFLDTDETLERTNWKQYSNTTWKYKLKYPPPALIEQKGNKITVWENSDKKSYVEIEAGAFPSDKDLLDFATLNEQLNSGLKSVKWTGEKNVTFNNIQALEYQFTDDNQSAWDVIYFASPFNGNVYVFRSDNSYKNNSFYGQILATFQLFD